MIASMNKDCSLKIVLSLVLFGFSVGVSLGQDSNKDAIGTESVTVVKSFTAELEEAKKKLLIPEPFQGYKTNEALLYRIKGFPEAEALVPKFGAPPLIVALENDKSLPGYASLVLGNYQSAKVDLNLSDALSRNGMYGISGHYDTYKGTLNDSSLDPYSHTASVEGNYQYQTSKILWNSGISIQRQALNFYGVFEDSDLATPVGESSNENEQQYRKTEAFSSVSLTSGWLHEAGFTFKSFEDITSTQEQQFTASAQFLIPISGEDVPLKTELVQLKGAFNNASLLSMSNEIPAPYAFSQWVVTPHYQIQNKQWGMDLGLKVISTSGDTMEQSRLNIFPAFYAQYKLSNDVQLKGGLEGDYKLNSFENFAAINPFVSPTLNLEPSYTKYRFFAGLEATSGASFSLFLRAVLSQEENSPLFTLNPLNYFRSDDAPYLRNGVASYRVVYDLINSASVQAGIHIYPNKSTDFNLGVSFNSYETTMEEAAWNLPKINAYANFSTEFLSDWWVNAQVNYIGSRQDVQVQVVQFIVAGEYPRSIVELPAYGIIQAELGYRYTENWSFNLGINNVGTPYTGWSHYPELGTQVLLGAQYHFDF